MATAAKSSRKKPEPATEVLAFKAFDRDLKCREYQFEVGKSYEQPGKIVVCENGFHSCENPFDVLDYYPLTDSRFCVVKASGEISRRKDDSKLASAKIKIGAELKLPEFIGKCVTYLLGQAKGESVQAASGNFSKLAASGDFSQLAASGNFSKLAASGDFSKLAASGDFSKLAASGDSSQLAASGAYSQLAASGNFSQLAASGDFSQLAASGDFSKLAASGNFSKLAASGDSSKLEINGERSAAAAVGNGSRVKAVAGTPVAICEYDCNGHPIGFATGIAGQDGVPADTWLIAKDGKLVEAK